jgi:hypothetical protein
MISMSLYMTKNEKCLKGCYSCFSTYKTSFEARIEDIFRKFMRSATNFDSIIVFKS